MKYAEQCRNAYRNLQDLDKRMNKSATFTGNCFNRITNANPRIVMPDTATSQQNNRPATSSYARPPSNGTTQLRIRNEDTKLSPVEC